MTRKRPAASTPSTEPDRNRVFVVDDHPMMLDGMRRLIDSESDMICCGTACSAEEAIGLLPRVQPTLVVTDLTLPKRSGLDLIKDIKAMLPETLVFVYSMHDETYYAERALRAGARGYLMKEAGSEKMLECIRRVMAGEIAVSPKIAARILDLFSGAPSRGKKSAMDQLSDREFEVYQLFGEGHSTKEIAARLHLSAKTIAVHRDHIRDKLGLSSAAEVVHHAIRWVENRGGSGIGPI